MGIPMVDRFLGCIQLQTGVLIIGVLHLILALLGAFVSAILLTLSSVWVSGVADGVLNQAIQGIKEGLQQADDESRAAFNQTLDTFAGLSNDDVGAAKIAVVVVTAILLVLCIFWIITCSLLIHGARKGKPGLLMPWYIVTAIGICFSVIQIVQQFINLQIGAAIGGIFGVIIGCYLLVVVWSFRAQLQQGEARAGGKA